MNSHLTIIVFLGCFSRRTCSSHPKLQLSFSVRLVRGLPIVFSELGGEAIVFTTNLHTLTHS